MQVKSKEIATNEVVNSLHSEVPTKENASATNKEATTTVNKESTKQRDRQQTQRSNNFEKQSNRKRNDSQYNNGRLRLLNRLLSRSIQHERNAIFQCITFIEKNNFFD